MKISIIGSGLRTPLLLHGLVHSDLHVSEISLYDVKGQRAAIMARLGVAMAMPLGVSITAANSLEAAVEGSEFVISGIRPGGLAARAADERLAVDHGCAGQETTGPTGFAMALRTVPVAIEQARVVERLAAGAWIINFTNPAGMITQAIASHTGAKVIGICDTPAELFWRIAQAIGAPTDEVQCDYFGLNHLGWVRGVKRAGHECLPELLSDDQRIARLYPAMLFPGELLRTLKLVPTEYLYFYYCRQKALNNQRAAGATRGEELLELNRRIWATIGSYLEDDVERALGAYRSYLNRRNVSYLRLEGAGESVLDSIDPGWDPFAAETGYHRIAVEAIRALSGTDPIRLVLNVPSQGAIKELHRDDVVEVPCLVSSRGAVPAPVGPLPDTVRGLMFAVKMHERLTIQAALERRADLATLALAANPIVGDWNVAREFTQALFQRGEPQSE